MTVAPTLEVGPDADGNLLRAADDRIVHFGRGPATGGGETLECARGTIRPGRVNAHTHVYSGLAPLGMPPPKKPPRNFVEILERVWWRLDRALDEASLRASARYYAAESLLAGTTTLIDHHESPSFIEGSLDVLAEACHEVGARALLCFGATERNGGRDEARRGLAECRRFIEANRQPGVRGVVGLHASFTVSDETVREAGELARELGTVTHVHVAEDGADVEDAKRRGYDGPLERLLELHALPAGSILAHGVWCTPEQVRRAAGAGLWFVQNPRSNRGNEVGYPRALGESDRVALGTDGYPAVMADEAATLFEEAERHGEERARAAPRIDAGYRLAAERLDVALAPLRAGGTADAVVVEAGEVRHVIAGGRVVVRDGALVGADLEEIRREARAQAPRLWERMEALP